MSAKPEILVVAAIPPELRARLSINYTLVEGRAGDIWPGIPVIVTTSMAGADAALIAALPDLKLITCNGTGLDKIDLAAARARGIVVKHTPDAVTEDTADFAIALIYATSRRLAEADRFVRAGKWKTERMTPSKRVSARTLGIVGLGKIGEMIARRASALGIKVLYTGPREKPDQPYTYHPNIRDLASAVDILVLSCPGGAATHHIVDAEVLKALGPEGTLINISRGSVVNESDLIKALETGIIGGAGLDVFASEPDIDARFLALENVVLQPHYASVTGETRQAMADVIETAIDTFYTPNPTSL